MTKSIRPRAAAGRNSGRCFMEEERYQSFFMDPDKIGVCDKCKLQFKRGVHDLEKDVIYCYRCFNKELLMIISDMEEGKREWNND